MKKSILFFILINTLCFSQTYKLGGSLNFAFPNEQMALQFGPSFNLALSYENIPVTFLGNARFLFGEGHTWSSTKSLGIGAVYFLKKDPRIFPYFSLSFFLNSYGLHQDHVGRDIHITSLPVNLSAELALGLNLNPQNEKFQVLVETAFSYNKPYYKYYLVRYDQNEILEGNLNYNALYMKIVFLFNI